MIHVVRRAQHQPRPGQRPRGLSTARWLECLDDPKVAQVHRPVPVEQDVAGFHVAMNVVLRVNVVQRLGDFQQPAGQLLRRHPLRVPRAVEWTLFLETAAGLPGGLLRSRLRRAVAMPPVPKARLSGQRSKKATGISLSRVGATALPGHSRHHCGDFSLPQRFSRQSSALRLGRSPHCGWNCAGEEGKTVSWEHAEITFEPNAWP